jgi:hypothetical protein
MDLLSGIDRLKLQDRAITINSIPPEILIVIFCYVVWSNSSWKADYPVLCSISRVCHHWRQLTLATSTLWTKVDTSDIGTAALMLARSQHHPVAICANENNGPIDMEALDRILMDDASHAGRIKTLYLSAKRDAVLQVLSALRTRHIVGLETFVVNVLQGSIRHRQSKLQRDMLSSVRILHVSGLELDLAAPALYQNLVDLSVEGRYNASDASSLCEMLRHTKALRRLSLRNAARAREPMLESQHPRVPLLFLKQFNLAGDSLSCAYISTLVDTPSSCITSISCIDEASPTQVPSHGHFSSVVSSAYRRIGDARYCILSLFDGMVHLRWYATSQEHVSWPMRDFKRPLGSVSLTLGFTAIWSVLISDTQRLCESLSTVSIDDLVFEASDDLAYGEVSADTGHAFLTLLQTLHRVQVIRASGFYARVLCATMDFGYWNLESLHCNELHLAYSPRLTHAELMMLREYLLCRLQHGRQVGRLAVRRCGGVMTDTAHAFQGIVREITVVDCFEDTKDIGMTVRLVAPH